MTKEEAIFCEGTYLGENNCIDCKYYATDTCESRESHKMAIEALKAEPRWIPVSKRLPEEYGVYLVTIGESTDFCIWNKKEWGWESRKGWEPNVEITAWMPLPEPWKGESE